ncbi:MAG TPA: tetraacyldisaccharide 4'-kinase [Verrucomicrobiales bacterium]|jgi:tetraacyldisaccharide 4'-kinase|nr:tetraacyldisaccharide 4'-kinase [Verrucomicrobiales bacterium]
MAKENLDRLEQFGIDVILGRRRGLKATMLRGFLNGLSRIFHSLVQGRLALFRHRIKTDYHLGATVVSIGNLTVGGTGKTPVVEMLARRLQQEGRRVAILSRGYKRLKPAALSVRVRKRIKGQKEEEPPTIVSTGSEILGDPAHAGDEPFMLARNLPGVAVVVDKDRVKAGRWAVRDFSCDTLILDDGLQYLKLRRKLDIVLVDRTAPFGNEYMLPRGTLREPPRNLRRASHIFLTKCDGNDNSEIISRIRHYNRTATVIECRHRPVHLQNLFDPGDQQPLEYLRGRKAATISGIAVPEGFEGILARLGADLVLTRRYTDHHRYNEDEINECILHADDMFADCVVTTEKDSVRFPELTKTLLPVYFLRVEIEILSGHEEFEECVERICRPLGAVPAMKIL